MRFLTCILALFGLTSCTTTPSPKPDDSAKTISEADKRSNISPEVLEKLPSVAALLDKKEEEARDLNQLRSNAEAIVYEQSIKKARAFIDKCFLHALPTLTNAIQHHTEYCHTTEREICDEEISSFIIPILRKSEDDQFLNQNLVPSTALKEAHIVVLEKPIENEDLREYAQILFSRLHGGVQVHMKLQLMSTKSEDGKIIMKTFFGVYFIHHPFPIVK